LAIALEALSLGRCLAATNLSPRFLGYTVVAPVFVILTLLHLLAGVLLIIGAVAYADGRRWPRTALVVAATIIAIVSMRAACMVRTPPDLVEAVLLRPLWLLLYHGIPTAVAAYISWQVLHSDVEPNHPSAPDPQEVR
jgi:hypothetical protein